MKKLALLCGLLASTASFAETKTEQAPVKDTRPMLALRVIDVSTKTPRPLKTNVISLKEKHQLCWMAFNMPFEAKNQVIQVFDTPAPAKYQIQNGSVVSSEDKKKHTITSSEKAINNEQISSCWKFDNTDPVGKYQLTVQVNNIAFPPQPFEITK